MSANFTIYVTSVAAAAVTARVAKDFAETIKQGAIGAASTSVGVRAGWPGSGAIATACAAAAAQKITDILAAETARSATVSNAKDLLRSQGEIPL
jgi:hypothetical protein